ncbi:hypothetical protein BO82DRAFT_28529 [Aspergillus uvarum CBS 121591]|uniref:Uncharacterized protein n=1 Tax=Aspergillus uvarum CBS 121591 TaxID=1448315 RepID=A0A319D7G5_9EURO|nr:hypothetical protein BO82DRAFT_28529 [Aspergillus uvarum CBS 121591]PYH83908.1 hypothetical protein BO82DRAFT_28529 [Aspergillus uvarum CBS 121591]
MLQKLRRIARTRSSRTMPFLSADYYFQFSGPMQERPPPPSVTVTNSITDTSLGLIHPIATFRRETRNPNVGWILITTNYGDLRTSDGPPAVLFTIRGQAQSSLRESTAARRCIMKNKKALNCLAKGSIARSRIRLT